MISPALALEYESVLKAVIDELGLSLVDIDDFTEYLCSRARLVQIYFRWRPTLPDPAMIVFWRLRFAHRIANRDVQHEGFPGIRELGIRTMRPGELWAIMGGKR